MTANLNFKTLQDWLIQVLIGLQGGLVKIDLNMVEKIFLKAQN
jgi:hypothetical protein